MINAPATTDEVARFEADHGVALPADYRSFLLHVGNGGVGPPAYGLFPLGTIEKHASAEERELWCSLRRLREPFPFTNYWVWEGGESSPEGTENDLNKGTIRLGHDGCGLYWHLVVTGPDRGIVWQFADVGIQPTAP